MPGLPVEERKQRFLKKARKNFWSASRGFGLAKGSRREPKNLTADFADYADARLGSAAPHANLKLVSG